ncbi:MAG: hypothetical protein V3S20_03070 [Dehalococcoidia bacterium]
MRVRDFMSLVLERTTERLPPELRRFDARIRFVWLQIHFWTPNVHYEVWLTRKTERIEIGLHFEGEREFSYRWAEVMAARMTEVQAQLGPRVELEEWTSSWTRIHQTIPYDPLSEPLADEVARLLAETISVLQPIVDQERENVPPELEALVPARRSGGRRFHRRGPRRRP